MTTRQIPRTGDPIASEPRRAHRGLVLLAAGALVLGACSSDDEAGSDATTTAPIGSVTSTTGVPRGADVAIPAVEGPITGGAYGVPFNPMPSRLADEHGYVEEEYFVSGAATAYAHEGEWGTDGEWAVAAGADTADFTTRIVVRRPADPSDFDGTVLVEWLNVSSGMDADPDFGFLHEELLAHGSAYVAVSAQAVGIHGGGGLVLPIPDFEVQALQEWDPERYDALEHPGDEYSYDIFSQVAALLRRPGDLDPLDGLRPTHVIAAGESQSAMRMVTYVNAVQPVADAFDGFLIHSRGVGSAPLNPASEAPQPDVVHIRSDLDVPVLQLQTETDLFFLGSHASRQEDTDLLRTWEVAGTAHADQSTLDYGFESGWEWSPGTTIDLEPICGLLNDGQQAEVARAAYAALRSWVVDGTPPPSGPMLDVVDGATIARDDDGIAIGGIRTPSVDVPIARLTGTNESGGGIICSLFGTTEPWSTDELITRYSSPVGYVDAVTAAADEAVEAGFLLPMDRDRLVEEAGDVIPRVTEYEPG